MHHKYTIVFLVRSKRGLSKKEKMDNWIVVLGTE